jgi:hypothetical protein
MTAMLIIRIRFWSCLPVEKQMMLLPEGFFPTHSLKTILPVTSDSATGTGTQE